MSELIPVKLSDIANIVTGSTPPSSQPDSWGDALDFITPSDQSDTYREANPSRFLSEEGAKRLHKRIVPARSTNLTCIGSTIGKVSMAMQNAVTNQQINSIVAKGGVAHPDFVYYLIKNWSGDLKQHASGSATPIINKSTLSNYEFLIPDLTAQEAIAEVLGALDDKIAANTRLIATTDSLAEAQFHAALRDNRSQPLSSFASFVNGKAFTKGASGTGRVVVRIAELNSGIGKSTVFSDAEVEEKHLARPGDILFAWSGSLTLHRWFRDEAIVNQHIFKVIPNDGTADWLIYELIRNKIEDFRRIAADKATTMGHIQRKHLDESVLIPSEAARQEIAPLMESLWQKALTAERENLTLMITRDALLPHLISGKLHVKEAEKILEGAL